MGIDDQSDGTDESPPGSRATCPKRHQEQIGATGRQEKKLSIRARLLRVHNAQLRYSHQQGGNASGAASEQIVCQEIACNDSQRSENHRQQPALIGTESDQVEPEMKNVIVQRGLYEVFDQILGHLLQWSATDADGKNFVVPNRLVVEVVKPEAKPHNHDGRWEGPMRACFTWVCFAGITHGESLLQT